MRKLSLLTWFRYVVRMGMTDNPKWPGNLEYGSRDPKEEPCRLGDEWGTEDFERSRN